MADADTTTDRLEKIIRPIVEGQLRGFLIEHPNILNCVDWYKPRRDKTETFVGSISKRITRDLTCEHTRKRLEKLFLECDLEREEALSGTSPWGEVKAAVAV